MRRLFILLLIVCVAHPAAAATPDIDAILISGKLSEGIVELETYLQDHPKDDTARLGLGAVQFLRSAERLTQKLAVYGPQTRGIPDLEAMLPEAPAPLEPLTYAMVRQLTQEWLIDLAQVQTTLSKIEDEQVKLPLHVGRIPLNLAGGGARALTLLPLLRSFRIGPPGKEAEFVITFDRADVDWLRGYCHILQALGEVGLAYDGQGLFDVFAHRLFKHVKTPHPFLLEPNRDPRAGWFSIEELTDVIAAIHMVRFPVVEPKRMAAALEHLEQTLSMSRQMWKRVLAETDNDHEWIPSPRQTGALNIAVNQEMVDNWLKVVDEAESVLQGKKLLPFWRGKETRGINLRRVFLEPTPLDLVLWVQGTAATPYLEEGEMTRPATWGDFDNAFGGRLMGFGFWFN
jgi:hypothetical protein